MFNNKFIQIRGNQLLKELSAAATAARPQLCVWPPSHRRQVRASERKSAAPVICPITVLVLRPDFLSFWSLRSLNSLCSSFVQPFVNLCAPAARNFFLSLSLFLLFSLPFLLFLSLFLSFLLTHAARIGHFAP